MLDKVVTDILPSGLVMTSYMCFVLDASILIRQIMTVP